MSHVTAQAGAAGRHEGGNGHGAMSAGNVTLSGGGNVLSGALIVLGLAGLAVTLAAGFMMTDGVKHALSAFHVGVMTVLALCLGSMFYVLVFHLTQAGWAVTIRRQFENVMSMVWLPAIFVLALILLEIGLTKGQLFTWLNSSIAGDDYLFTGKKAYLNPVFFVLRAVFYVMIWFFLARKLWGFSREQDLTGDKWLSNKARFNSAWGILIFALTTAFAAFDWLMGVDYRFFSTMWGVYYFAGAAFSSVPLVVIILSLLRRSGKLNGVVTDEHIHDLAKLMFAFTVFWAYIGFSQYFLIWYSNIPEETSFYLARKSGGWEHLSMFLVLGHFVVPFFILLWRAVRRSYVLLSIMAGWAVLMEAADIFWIVRPMVYAGVEHADKVHADRLWLDAAGLVGVLALFLGLLVRKIYSGPLVPLKDPRLPEALHHRNYI